MGKMKRARGDSNTRPADSLSQDIPGYVVAKFKDATPLFSSYATFVPGINSGIRTSTGSTISDYLGKTERA
jgi:hypothetical protein